MSSARDWCSARLMGQPLIVDDRPWVVVDTETDGLDARRHRITEFAAVVIHADTVVESRWSWALPDGDERLSATVCALDEPLRHGVVVGHNLSFDLDFLCRCGATSRFALAHPARWLCTMRLAGGRSLSSLARSLSIVPVSPHTATGDAETLALILGTLLAACRRHGLPLVSDLEAATRGSPAPRPARGTQTADGWLQVLAELDVVAPMSFTGGAANPAVSAVKRHLASPILGPRDPAELELAVRILRDAGVTANVLQRLLDEACSDGVDILGERIDT